MNGTSNMFNLNLSEILEEINPTAKRPLERKLNEIEDKFVRGFEDVSKNWINSIGYKNYESEIDACVKRLLEEELQGICSDDTKIGVTYYNEFNRECAFAFQNRLDKDTHRYGGYSISQIVYDIMKAADELSSSERSSYTTNGTYRLRPLADRFCSFINITFAKSREASRKKYIEDIEKNKYRPLNPIANYNHPDPLLKINAEVQRICHLPTKDSAKYMSFPVAMGNHISDKEQEGNIHSLLKPIVAGYGQPGGFNALLGAGTGTGKTYAIDKVYAPIIGEMCNCQVYLTMPTTPQLEQAKQYYGCDVRFARGEVHGMGSNPSLRVYVYECVDEIPAVTFDPLTCASRPNILIIDEAHSLLTEKYRKKSLDKIVKKAQEILSAGGVVIATSASTEMIGVTMPYNSISGYDLICNVFRVSSKNALTNGLKYPLYTYEDAIKYGKAADVAIVNAIPAKNIKVVYKSHEDNCISSPLATIILSQLKKGKKILAEYNNIDQLMTVKNILDGMGYCVIICSANDKHFTPDKETKKNIYNNKVYNDILNHNMIDFSEVDVVLTTKLLENGTTINSIKGPVSETDVTTIFVVEKKDRLNLEAFEQFSGRLRFMHDDAILLMVEPEETHSKYKKEMSTYLRKDFNQIQSLAEKLRNHMISAARLRNIDLQGREDMPEGMNLNGYIDAYTISEAMYRAVNEFYRALMYDKDAFEGHIKERYPNQSVTFEKMEKSAIEVESAHDRLSVEAKSAIADCLNKAFRSKEIREEIISRKHGIDTEKGQEKNQLYETMCNYSRKSYIDDVQTTLSLTMGLQDIKAHTEIISDECKGVPKGIVIENIDIDTFIPKMEAAINAKSKRYINVLKDTSISSGFKYLAQYKGLSIPIRSYAMKYGDRNSNEDEFLYECELSLPNMPTDFKEKVIALMRNLFMTDKKKRIDRLVYSCMLGEVDMNFYAEMAKKNSSELEQISLIYEFSSYALNPTLIHPDDTASGATFAAVTGAEAYVALTGADGRTYTGLTAFCCKRLTKERVGRVYKIYKNHMQKKGFKFDSSIESGRLKILRLFAAVFTYTREISTSGEVYIVLGDLRKRRPTDYDQILHLSFRSINR